MLTSEFKDFARIEKIPNPEREFEKFKDHWISQPGQKGVKKDWLATWRNWVRRSKEFNGQTNNIKDGRFR